MFGDGGTLSLRVLAENDRLEAIRVQWREEVGANAFFSMPAFRVPGQSLHLDDQSVDVRLQPGYVPMAVFGAEHANVQAHSGSQANLAAYLAVLEPGDTILGMALDQGGHLTHGSPVNFSGRLYDVAAYGVREEDGRVDMDEIAEMARRERPAMIVAGASAYSRLIDFPRLREIADEGAA